MAICIVDQAGPSSCRRRFRPTSKCCSIETLAPYRLDVVVAVECLFAWYWVVDLCRDEKIPFVLGHALYMKAIHGGKAEKRFHHPRLVEIVTRCSFLFSHPARLLTTMKYMMTFSEWLTRRDEGLLPDHPPIKGMPRFNTTLGTDAERKRLHPKKVKPPKLFPPTVREVKEIVPNKLIPKLKPMTPVKPRPPLG